MGRITIDDIKGMKARGERIPVITAYDSPIASLADSTGFPVILVGDSLGMVVLGYDSTIPVTMDDMVHHTKAVSRSVSHSFIVSDMPFMTFQVGLGEALRNAARLVQEGGAQSVKIEGGERVADQVRCITEAGIPVMGHVGLTPQSVHQLGGYKVQGRLKREAQNILNDVTALEQAGAYAVVLELIPTPLAKMVTGRISIPTIGIGSGPYCDGQVQVVHDILGLCSGFAPKHSKCYVRLNELIADALRLYMDEVIRGDFPSSKQSVDMDETLLSQL